ncbi:MAG: hypothetical protein ACI8S6_002484, partial [Myxococcota bacterium]
MDPRLRELLSSEDRDQVQQGCELAVALGDGALPYLSSGVRISKQGHLMLQSSLGKLFQPSHRLWGALCLLAATGRVAEVEVLDIDRGPAPPQLHSLTPLQGASRLRRLTLQRCAWLTSLSPLSDLPSLSSLTLRLCTRLRHLAPLAKLPKLSRLSLFNCTMIEDHHALGDFPALRRLVLRHPRPHTITLPEALLGRLAHLELGDGLQLSELSSLSAGRRLRVLRLEGCRQLSDLSSLSEMTALSELVVTEGMQLSDLSPLWGLP